MLFWLVILGAWMWADAVYGKHPDSGAHPALESVSGKPPPCATDAPLPEPPPMFRAEPAVVEAELVIQGRSISRAITDGRVI